MALSEHLRNWLAPAIAGVGFVGLLATFVAELGSFRDSVEHWARRELEARAELAAKNLAGPLRTGDFKTVYAAGSACEDDGIRMVVSGAGGGLVYDSHRLGTPDVESVSASAPSGDFSVRLAMPLGRVLAPFRRARTGFALAALSGGFGMLLVFVFTYRQHVRMAEMKRLERFRSEFVADVSHELKTPLTGILGAVDLLAGGSAAMPPEATEDLLRLLEKESKRLDALAQGILDLARLERVRDAVRMERCDLADVLNDVTESFAPRFAQAGMKLDLRIGADAADAAVQCDPQLVFRAVSNLLANALRHSGSADVAVALARSGAWYEIAVEDHGKGISREDGKRIFERFYRVDRARGGDTGGTGLGLAIVRAIAALHGGTVRLEDLEPSGCRFVLTLAASGGAPSGRIFSKILNFTCKSGVK